MNKPPAAGQVMQLPAGGVFHGEVSCNRAFTTFENYKVGEDIMGCDVAGPDGDGGALHSTDKYGIPASETKNVKGCGLGIAYKSDPTTIVPEDFVMISTNASCPWRRDVDFQIPSGLPACPPGGCHCLWGWIHNADAGTEQMYQLMYRCEVTGNTGTVPLPPAQVARKCPFDKNNCTVGAKAPHYWLQNERNNNFQHWTDPPFYNEDFGFQNGAQTDLWATDVNHNDYNGGEAPGPLVTPTMNIAITPAGQGTTAPKSTEAPPPPPASSTSTTTEAPPPPSSTSSSAAKPTSTRLPWWYNPMGFTDQFPPGQKRDADGEDTDAVRRLPPQARRLF